MESKMTTERARSLLRKLKAIKTELSFCVDEVEELIDAFHEEKKKIKKEKQDD